MATTSVGAHAATGSSGEEEEVTSVFASLAAGSLLIGRLLGYGHHRADRPGWWRRPIR